MQTTLPKGWKWVKLDEIVNVDKGKKMATIMSHSKDCQPYIGIDNLRTTQYTNFTKEKDGLSCIETDLLIAWDGANAGTIGYGLKGYVGSTIARLRPSGSTTTYYLGHFLKSKFQQFNIQTHGAAIPHLSKSQLLNTLIPLPPLPTQHKIVEILEEADNLRKLRQQADEKMKDLIPSIFVQMFGDPETNPKGWEIVELYEAATFKRGPFGGSLKKEIFITSGYKVYEQRNAIYNDFTIGSYYIDEEKYKAMLLFAIQPDDLIVSCSGTMGKVAIVPQNAQKGIINQALLKITPKKHMTSSLYLKFLIESNSIQSTYFKNAAGSAIQNVTSVSALKKIKIPLPPLPLQQEFAKLVEDIEAEKARQAESGKKLDELFQSLMHRAFTGELAA